MSDECLDCYVALEYLIDAYICLNFFFIIPNTSCMHLLLRTGAVFMTNLLGGSPVRLRLRLLLPESAISKRFMPSYKRKLPKRFCQGFANFYQFVDFNHLLYVKAHSMGQTMHPPYPLGTMCSPRIFCYA